MPSPNEFIKVMDCKQCGGTVKLPKNIAEMKRDGTLSICDKCSKIQIDKEIKQDSIDFSKLQKSIKNNSYKYADNTTERLTPDEISDMVRFLWMEIVRYPPDYTTVNNFQSALKNLCAVKVKANFQYWIFTNTDYPNLKKFLMTMGVNYFDLKKEELPDVDFKKRASGDD